MATILDSLMVILGLDTSGFSAGQKRVSGGLKSTRGDADKTAASMSDFTKKSGEAIGKLRNEAIGLFLAFQGGSSITGFVKNMVTSDAAAGRLADNLGMNVTRMTAYGLAVKSVGGETEDAQSALAMLAKARTDLQMTGTTDHNREFAFLGFNADTLNDTAGAFDKLAEAAQRMPRTQFYNLAKGMGLTDGVINLLELGPQKMRALIDARMQDAATTQRQTEAAQDLEAKWADLASTVTGLVRPVVAGLVGDAIDLINNIRDVAKVSPGARVALEMLGGAANGIADTFRALGAEVKMVMDYILGQLAQFEKTYAHAVYSSHGFIGGRDLYNSMVQSGVKNWDDIDRVIDQRNAAEARAAAASPAGTNGGDASGGTGAYDTVVGNGRFGSARVSQMTMGDVIAFGRNTLIPNTRAAGIGRDRRGVVGSSAAGRYQITGETLTHYGRDVFGENWRNMKFDAAAQDKLAERIFNDNKRGDLAARWASLKDHRAGAYAGIPWSQMREIIARGETGGGGGGSSRVQIDKIEVHTQARDADAIARDLPPAIRRRMNTGQANRNVD